jgi:hypothetical protein
MKTKWVFAMMFLSFFFAGQILAGSVYYWTDENGVRHYSNTGVPEHVMEADVRPEEASSPPAGQISEADSDTNAEGSPNNPPEGESGEPGDGAAPGPADEATDDRMAQRVEKERARLEAEIKRIKNRGMSRTFTEGMRDNLLRPLEEQLALLNADPERYFRMKRQGAFNSADSGSAGTPPSPGEAGPARFSAGQPRSSSGGQAGVETGAPDDAEEEGPQENASAEEQQPRRSTRSDGSAASTLFPED